MPQSIERVLVYTAALSRGLFSGMRRRAVALHVAVLPGWRSRLLDVRSARRCICGEGRSQPPRAVPAVPVGPLRTGRPWVCESRSTANGGTSGSTSGLCNSRRGYSGGHSSVQHIDRVFEFLRARRGAVAHVHILGDKAQRLRLAATADQDRLAPNRNLCVPNL